MPRRSPGPLRRGQFDRHGRPNESSGAEDDDRSPLGGMQTQHTRDGEFHVRNIPGAAARKTYRCPGCSHEIPVGAAHVVVWPTQDLSWTESATDARRHWHSSCWHRRSTRGGPGPLV